MRFFLPELIMSQVLQAINTDTDKEPEQSKSHKKSMAKPRENSVVLIPGMTTATIGTNVLKMQSLLFKQTN